MNRAQIESLKVGDPIQRSMLGQGQFTETRITEITFRVTNPSGKLCLGIYTEFGTNSSISGTVTEDDDRYFRLPVEVTE